jgi:hypothetical protein
MKEELEELGTAIVQVILMKVRDHQRAVYENNMTFEEINSLEGGITISLAERMLALQERGNRAQSDQSWNRFMNKHADDDDAQI